MLRRGIQMLHTAITAILKHEFKAIHVSKPGNSREGEEYRLSAFYLLCHFLSETRCDGTIILDGDPVFLVFGSDKPGAVWCRLGVGDKVESVHLVMLFRERLFSDDFFAIIHGLLGALMFTS